MQIKKYNKKLKLYDFLTYDFQFRAVDSDLSYSEITSTFLSVVLVTL